MHAQKPLPSEATEEDLPPSVEAALKLPLSEVHALTLLLSVDSAHKPPRDVEPPPRPPSSEVSAVLPLRLPKAVKLLAPLVDVSHLPPLIDVTVPQDLTDLAVPQDPIVVPALADPKGLPEASRDVVLHQLLLLLTAMVHKGQPEAKNPLTIEPFLTHPPAWRLNDESNLL